MKFFSIAVLALCGGCSPDDGCHFVAMTWRCPPRVEHQTFVSPEGGPQHYQLCKVFTYGSGAQAFDTLECWDPHGPNGIYYSAPPWSGQKIGTGRYCYDATKKTKVCETK